MKAITISQPYASMIANGEKFVENRTWPTNYRGEIAIHAGKGLQYLDRDELAEYPTGCVIAVAKLVACLRIEDITVRSIDTSKPDGSRRAWKEIARHVHAEGPWCWVLEDVQQIEPCSWRGSQGLWEWDPPVLVRSLTTAANAAESE